MTDPYYADEAVTLYLGDCREVTAGLQWDALVTDPPYGLGERWQGGTWGAAEMYADARRWDVRPDLDFLVSLIERSEQSIVWGANYFSLPPSRCWLAWVKNPPMATMADLELAWTSLDRPAKLITSTRNPDGQRVHPTQKPLTVMRWCVQQLAAPRVLLDPYAGSGTTLRAAKDLGIAAIGVEIDERYCEIAARRLSQGVLDFGDAS